MKRILSKQSSRFLTTLEYLYYNDFSTINELAALSKVSIHTIHEDVKKINAFIHPMLILKNELHECHLAIPNNFSCDFFYSRILYDSLEFTFIEKLFFEEKETLEDYADSLFISLSTLKRIVSRINKQVKQSGIYISTNPVQLVGDEKKVRNMFFYFLKEKYIDFNYPFKEEDHFLTTQLLNYIISQKEEFTNFPDIEKINLIIFISLTRVKNGHRSGHDYSKFHLDSEDQLLINNPKFSELLASSLAPSYITDNDNSEILFELLFPLFYDNYFFCYHQAFRAAEDNKEISHELTTITNLIDYICENLNVFLPHLEREKLILKIVNVRLLTFGENFLIYNSKRNFICNLKKDYPLVYIFLDTHILRNPLLSSYLDSEREQITYFLITHWSGLLFKIQNSLPVLNVGVCMTSDNEHSELIATILERKFHDRCHFEPIFFTNHLNVVEQFNNYDFILTNISEPFETRHTIISIDLYPSTKDISKIRAMYIQLNSARRISSIN